MGAGTVKMEEPSESNAGSTVLSVAGVPGRRLIAVFLDMFVSGFIFRAN